jgi:hypothetical protein
VILWAGIISSLVVIWEANTSHPFFGLDRTNSFDHGCAPNPALPGFFVVRWIPKGVKGFLSHA